LAKLNALRTKLPNAQITTCTYKPLVGLQSATDPRGVTTYYEYDSSGRLKEIYYYENGVKKVIENNDYHFRE
jgi:YD repeat-containing protein